MPGHILVIQEAQDFNQNLLQFLAAKGYQVYTTELERADNCLSMAPPDLAVLNLRHFGAQSHPLCQRIFQQAGNLIVPMIMLTESCDEGGLPLGPEACLVSPLSPEQVVTVIELLLQDNRARILSAGEVLLRLDTRRVNHGNISHHLSPREFCLLETFLRHPAETLSRCFLMREVWNTDFVGDTRTLDVHIHLVRKKMEPDPRKPRYLKTVRGVGYRFVPTPSEH